MISFRCFIGSHITDTLVVKFYCHRSFFCLAIVTLRLSFLIWEVMEKLVVYASTSNQTICQTEWRRRTNENLEHCKLFRLRVKMTKYTTPTAKTIFHLPEGRTRHLFYSFVYFSSKYNHSTHDFLRIPLLSFLNSSADSTSLFIELETRSDKMTGGNKKWNVYSRRTEG